MTFQGSGSSADINHDSWIAAARREADELRQRSTHAGPPAGVQGRYLSDVELRQTLEAELKGYTIGSDVFRGGQGVVFRASQVGTRRDVAIKMLRESPLVGSSGVARFEREVQILSQLRHPNIVSVLETGQLSGNYYFVMDFIEGWSLDDFVVENRPDVKTLLEHFACICDAVNVAHLRGIIHRDLKPGNVRVDRGGSPHVMDFGLAKVSEHDDFHTAMTMTGQFVGSLPWASPEQVEATPEGIDIRTDVYSIGVMLYHALTGKFPYPVGESFRQTIDHICHTEPEPPGALREELGDEVDQIVLKCLKKERELRYQSAGSIAKDIRRYLNGEAIEAKRDSTWYVVRKAVRKHRVTATIIGLAAVLVVYGIGSLIYFLDVESKLRVAAENALTVARNEAQAAADARDDAEQQRGIAEKEKLLAVEARDEAIRQTRIAAAVNQFFNQDLLAAVAPDALGRDVTVREALDAASSTIDRRFEDEPLIRGEIQFVMGNTYMRLGVVDKAEAHLADALVLFEQERGPDDDYTLMALNDVARVYLARGKFDKAIESFRKCYQRRLDVFGPENHDTLNAMGNLAWTYAQVGNHTEAEPLLIEAYETRVRVFGEEDEQTLALMNNVALFYHAIGNFEKAAELCEKELAISKRIMPDDPRLFTSMGNLASMYGSLKRYDRAEALQLEVLEGRRNVFGESHPDTILAMNNLATLYSRIDRIPEAEKLSSEALDIALAEHGEDLPIVNSLRSKIGWFHNYNKRFAEAEPFHADAIAGARRMYPTGHRTIAIYLHRYGDCLTELGKFEEAEAALIEAHSSFVNDRGESSNDALNVIDSLVGLYKKMERPDAVEKWTEIYTTAIANRDADESKRDTN